MSGGQQQMLAIGRGLMSRSKILLLDEPSLGLAPVLVQEVFRVIQEINKTGTTILLVEQNARMALLIANRGFVLETGRMMLNDTAANCWSNEDMKRTLPGRPCPHQGGAPAPPQPDGKEVKTLSEDPLLPVVELTWSLIRRQSCTNRVWQHSMLPDAEAAEKGTKWPLRYCHSHMAPGKSSSGK